MDEGFRTGRLYNLILKIYVMTINFNGMDTDFKEVFYPYCKIREGYRNHVYPDDTGKLTVGIGHLLPQDGSVSEGDYYTDQQIQDLFNADYDRLNIEQYISENTDYSYNMMLAIAHF